MNETNYASFNPRTFKNRLSPFGQKVFQVLVEQWSTERSDNFKANQRRFCESTPQNYALRESSNRIVTQNNTTDQTNDYGRKKCHLKFIGRGTPLASSTFELLNLKATSEKDKKVYRSNDLVKPIESDICSNLDGYMNRDIAVNECGKHNTDDLRLFGTTSNTFEASYDLLTCGENVTWSNMFDTELFENKIITLDDDKVDEIEPSFPNFTSTFKQIMSQDLEKETFKKPLVQSVKRKSSLNEVNLRPPKEKKIESTAKNTFRKEKYTKSVKNWLNDINTFSDTPKDGGFYDPKEVINLPDSEKKSVEQNKTHEELIVKPTEDLKPLKENNKSSNPVSNCKEIKKNKVVHKQKQKQKELKLSKQNIESTSSDYVHPEGKTNKNVAQKQYHKKKQQPLGKAEETTATEADPLRETTSKKVVQAQLTNKGGKMKFDKPRNVADDDKKEESPDKNVAIVNQKSKEEKEKRNKSKFVAPIKSQIPVKDLTYNINIIDTCNVGDHVNSLRQVEKSEVFVVLVYSNGFCQLNGCYTDDTCVPEGLMISVIDDGNEKYYYFTKMDDDFRPILALLFESNTIICYEGKNILLFLSYLSMNLQTVTMLDAKVGGSLLNPESPPETFSDLQKLVAYVPEYTIATDSTLQKVAWYMCLLKECVVKLKAMMIQNSLWKVFEDVEMRLLPIIADMESRGVTVDLDKLKSMEHLLITKLKDVEQKCHAAAGKTFQVNSTQQVRALLFDELKLDTKCNVKIRETLVKGAKSTSEATLRCLMSVHPLPKLILEYRHLHKAHATFLTGIAQHVKDGVVQPTWVQTAAATGRIASNNPNLQAIPKAPFSLIMFPEPEDTDNPVLNFRSVYISRPEHCLLAADFRHVECRVFAHAAADTALLDALRSEDLFSVLAAKWLNKSEAEVSSADRERTKRIVYASLYGAGARKLADILDVGYDQTLAIMASFNRTFPALKSFGRSVVGQCERSGGRLSTLCGRARVFNHISSQDFAAKSHAERQAVNFVVQGSAADLCKMAMILTEARLRGARPALRARLLLQIHDELVWEVHADDLHAAAGVVKEVMESCGHECGLPLRLPVALRAGFTWGDMEALDVP